ncbi:hypothetical protein ASE11_19095 [Hydrogenophaga sp. Root209]|nr:hypothetical protein ASE11_19095 [Hydrogenophaga sp. Root209]
MKGGDAVIKKNPTVLPTTLHPEQRLKLAAVEALTGTKKSKIYAAIAAGKFPAPERDGPRCSRWRAGTVLDYLQARVEAQQ